VLNSAHCLVHQFWTPIEVPLRVFDVHMTEIGRQDGQETLRILVRSVPVHKGVRGESMAHVMQTRSMVVAIGTQADLP
jgi:hypothetical protein